MDRCICDKLHGIPDRHDLCVVILEVGTPDLLHEVCSWRDLYGSTLQKVWDVIGDWCTIITYSYKNMYAIELLLSAGHCVSTIFDVAKLIPPLSIIPIAHYLHVDDYMKYILWYGPHFTVVSKT